MDRDHWTGTDCKGELTGDDSDCLSCRDKEEHFRRNHLKI